MAKDQRKSDSTTQIYDLPWDMLLEIILKLSPKSIVFCKSVCKTWHRLISDPKNAKLHLTQSKPCLLIRDHPLNSIARALYFLEPENGCDFDSERALEMKSKLKIPVRNADALLSLVEDNANMVFCTRQSAPKPEVFFELSSRVSDHSYRRLTSCKGLLCLASGVNRAVVCNPITGEFIYLSVSDYKYGTIEFGFSPKHDQYKALHVFYTGHTPAKINTLGTDSWRDILNSRLKPGCLDSPAYFKGALHWFRPRNVCIALFNFDDERFDLQKIPSSLYLRRVTQSVDIKFLRDRLCLCKHLSDGRRRIDISAIQEYGVPESWAKLFSIGIPIRLDVIFIPETKIYLDNEALLMSASRERRLICYDDQSGGVRFKQVSSRYERRGFEVIAHTPSFVSLKDILATSNDEVFNVNSRCGKIEFTEEAYPMFLR